MINQWEVHHGEVIRFRFNCCALPEYHGPVVQEAPDLSYWRCLVCQCRHFRLVCDPGLYAWTVS